MLVISPAFLRLPIPSPLPAQIFHMSDKRILRSQCAGNIFIVLAIFRNSVYFIHVFVVFDKYVLDGIDIKSHVSEEVIRRKIYVLKSWSSLEKCEKKELCKIAEDDERKWPVEINPKTAPYFSQYDLASRGGTIAIDDFWMDMQIDSMRDSLLHANALLRIK